METNYENSCVARIYYHTLSRTSSAAGITQALSALTGAGPAVAAPARKVDASAPSMPSLPGALGHKRGPEALLEHRYLWDLEGNLLLQEASEGTSTYVYDAQNRLIVSATALKANMDATCPGFQPLCV